MYMNDTEWLGEHAAEGPLIRAGLGILLARGDWTWWHHPSAASTIMLDAIANTGIVEWGGDPAVLDASDWLDLNTALELAQAFRVVVARRGGDLRLKVQRTVHSWVSVSPIWICDDLAHAFDRERIFVEWPTDRRPRRPAASAIDGVSIASSEHLSEATRSLVESLPGSHWQPPARPAVIAIATLAELLQHPYTSELLIILDSSYEAISPYVDTIRATTGAQCAIFLRSTQPNISSWLEVFGACIASRQPVDRALREANREVESHGFIIASTQSFMVHSARMFFPPTARTEERDAPKDRSPTTSLGTAIKPIAYRQPRIPNLEIKEVRMQAAPPNARVLQAMCENGGESITVFPFEGIIKIRISIQNLSPLKRGIPAFPDENLEWQEDHKQLHVHLLEKGAAPRTSTLSLPRSGPSTPAVFDYEVRRDHEVDTLFVVSEGTRILQTARLRGVPGSQIDFTVEAFNSSVDQQKSSFDIAVLVNSYTDAPATATILTSEGIRLTEFEFSPLVRVRDELRTILEQCLVPDAPFHTALFNLANCGKLLLDALKDLIPEWPTSINRLQLTTPSNEYFPVEYFYDGDIPENEDASLCSSRAACLKAGTALMNCEIRQKREQLCPMGFMGITSVIERRTWHRSMDKTLWLKQSTELAKRNHITELQRALFAASDKADDFLDSDVPAGFPPTRTADIEAISKGWRKNNWQDWKKAIETINPKLLVLIPHIENNHLYIGEEQKLALASISRFHIGNADPVIIALGCNSAVGLTSSTSLPAILLRGGAKVVIASLTSVLGRFANTAAADLTAKLMSASMSTSPITVGELLTLLRRDFLAKDNALGMGLIAFGDADCCIGVQQS